jgi:hypothetical protein
MTKHIGIWIDHRRATIIALTNNKESISLIKFNVKGHLRMKGGSRSSTPYGPQDIASEKSVHKKYMHRLHQYYQEIVGESRDADKILIFGPGKAKTELKKEICKIRVLAPRIVGVETEDKMTEKQIVAKVKHYYQLEL